MLLALLLRDSLENPFRAGALARTEMRDILASNTLAQPFPDVKLKRGVERNLAFLARGFESGRRDRAWRGGRP